MRWSLARNAFIFLINNEHAMYFAECFTPSMNIAKKTSATAKEIVV